MYSDFIEYIKNKYKISDNDLHKLFAVNKKSHFETLQVHPEWYNIVKEFENIL